MKITNTLIYTIIEIQNLIMAKSHTIELAQRLEMLKQAFYHIIATLIYAHIPHYLGY